MINMAYFVYEYNIIYKNIKQIGIIICYFCKVLMDEFNHNLYVYLFSPK